MNMVIDDKDIEWAERLLLPTGCHFNDERRTFIRCMETRDVIACPGSGKTTALLAKLLILGSRMPFPDGRGVCVLTHTNVAIDQIKSQAGVASEILFRHPNFFGTIQGFTDRFLALPAYRDEFGQAIQSVDAELYLSAVQRGFRNLKVAKRWLEERQGPGTLASFWFDPIDLSIRKDLEHDIQQLGKDTPTYKEMLCVRQRILQAGILSYNDAFSLALRSFEKHPDLSKAFAARFAFAFVDEMQDTEHHQQKVLAPVFGDNAIVLQRLGDPNQAIYHSNVAKDAAWQPNQNALPFSDSVRYGSSISKILSTVRVNCQVSLAPNPTRDSLAPHLLCFTEHEKTLVLPAFLSLIKTFGLHQREDIKSPVFKAVGWVGQDKGGEGRLCLPSYFDYRKPPSKQLHFSNIISYLNQATASEIKFSGSSVYRAVILRGLTQALTLAGKRHPESKRTFTPQTFLHLLRQKDEASHDRFLNTLAKWTLILRRQESSIQAVRDEIAVLIRKEWCPDASAELDKFLTDNESEISADPQKASNIFPEGDSDIRIEVATVHSVKGETHTATLYLETYYDKKTCSERLLPFLKGLYPDKESKKARHIENLKVAHVAFSRPTHLLAFACQKTAIAGHEEDLKAHGWVIKYVSEILKHEKPIANPG
jgi:hypothetical protein